MRPGSVLLAAVLVLAPALAGCAADENADPPSGEDASSAPAWSFTDTDGVTHSRDSAAGAPVVLFFMATWCSSCKSMTPMLRDVAAEYEPVNLSAFSVSVDPSDADAALESWKETYDQAWPHGRDADGSMQRTFDVRSQSSVVVLDAHGNVVRAWGYGQATGDGVRAALDDALARGA